MRANWTESSKAIDGVVGGVLLFAFLSYQPIYLARADEVPVSPAAQDFPEGSSSVIESLTWRVTTSDPAALHQRTKALVGQIPEAVVVKENESLLVVSLPTQKLPTLRQELSKLGSVSPAEGEAPPSAPTTLL
ncbi:MAG TPA: hypothetical protein VGX03_23215, partial [Candidatus Binatia bacterium]|nr:hypothetical protein [Candidatus Binatia bacterium]